VSHTTSDNVGWKQRKTQQKTAGRRFPKEERNEELGGPQDLYGLMTAGVAHREQEDHIKVVEEVQGEYVLFRARHSFHPGLKISCHHEIRM